MYKSSSLCCLLSTLSLRQHHCSFTSLGSKLQHSLWFSSPTGCLPTHTHTHPTHTQPLASGLNCHPTPTPLHTHTHTHTHTQPCPLVVYTYTHTKPLASGSNCHPTPTPLTWASIVLSLLCFYEFQHELFPSNHFTLLNHSTIEQSEAIKTRMGSRNPS